MGVKAKLAGKNAEGSLRQPALDKEYRDYLILQFIHASRPWAGEAYRGS